MESDVLRVINNLSTNLVISMKKMEKDFSATITLNIGLHCEMICN